jgi:hypothetical protein
VLKSIANDKQPRVEGSCLNAKMSRSIQVTNLSPVEKVILEGGGCDGWRG